MTPFQHVLIVALNLGAGFFVFIALTNRILGRLRDSISKPLVMLGLLILLVGGPGLIAYRWPAPVGLWLAFSLWLALALGELRQLLVRYSRRGDPPAERCYVNPAISQRSAFTPVNTALDIRLDRYNLPVAAVNPARRERLRIVHLSDWHITRRLPESYYHLVIDQANDASPDLVFLTGDFITHHENIARLPALLGRLRSRYGAFAILGNHDVWAGSDDVILALQTAGVGYLGGGCRRLDLPDHPPLVLAGDEQPWHSRHPKPWPALAPGEIGLGLSHSADQVRRFSRWGAAAVFTGHYHGGQFCLPGLGPLIVPSRYGRRYARGHYVVDDTHLFVSAGVGCAAPPVRLFCPPDFLVVDLVYGA